MAYFRLRFITEPDWVSASIRAVTSSLWSHVETILPDGTYLGAHYPSGVQIRPLDYCKPMRERRYKIPVSDAALGQMLAFAHAQVGKPYDTTDIFGILMHEGWNNPDAWICSALETATMEAGGIFPLNVEVGYTPKITPEMLHLSPLLIGNCYFSAG